MTLNVNLDESYTSKTDRVERPTWDPDPPFRRGINCRELVGGFDCSPSAEFLPADNWNSEFDTTASI
jgi:hypothetical protein